MGTVDRRVFLAALGCWAPLAAQEDDPITVAADHPRLFLRPARLRLLRRERERTSPRWQQFEALVNGNAPMPERGLAQALYYQISRDAGAGRKALAWASVAVADFDLRQLALVFDWCQDLLSEAQSQELAARLEKAIAAAPRGDESIAAVRSRALAAVVLFDHVPDTPQRVLERVVREWWRNRIVAGLAQGRAAIALDDAYPLFELLHAVRDNTMVELREGAPKFLRDFPIEHLLSHYPVPHQATENDYWLGAARQTGPPDLRRAALDRAAELAMVAYDANAAESQLLQGWLMHDRFMLRGTFGAPYEFLWANPYQPGLSYDHAPLVYHDAAQGRLFARSTWDDEARWVGCFDGAVQVFDAGRVAALNPRAPTAISLDQTMVCFGSGSPRFRISVEQEQPVFLAGLEARRAYQVEIDGQEMFEASTDPGGILELAVAKVKDAGMRVHPVVR